MGSLAVRIVNSAAQRFVGWRRLTTPLDSLPMMGTIGGRQFRRGKRVGISVDTVDIHVDLLPGQVFLGGDVIETPFHQIELPVQARPNPIAYYGEPAVWGVPFGQMASPFSSIEVDGACLAIHNRGRIGAFVFDLFIRLAPDQTFAPATLTITHSDPTQPSIVAALPQDLRLTCGGAVMLTQGLDGTAVRNVALMPSGDTMGDGQSRTFPITIYWESRGATNSATIDCERKTSAIGIQVVGPLGVGLEVGRFDVQRWMTQHRASVLRGIIDWSAPSAIGVPANSTQTGDEEEQGAFQGVEPLLAGGSGAEHIRYLAALAQHKRPCHHREVDGGLLSLTGHPGLVLWQSRPHFRTTRDRLGKLEEFSASRHGHGWYGPDNEHWLMHSTCAALELTGDPVFQMELETHARNWLYSDTVTPANAATSQPGAARAIGYAGLFVAQVWRLLNNRTIADLVRHRWTERVDRVYLPRLSNRPWDFRPSFNLVNGERVAVGAVGAMDVDRFPYFSMLYQCAVGAYGAFVACNLFGHEQGVQWAVAEAERVVYGAYNLSGLSVEWETIGLQENYTPPTLPDYYIGGGAHRTGWYRYKWLPLCLWPLLRAGAEGSRERAATIRERLVAEGRLLTKVGATYSEQPLDWIPKEPTQPA